MPEWEEERWKGEERPQRLTVAPQVVGAVFVRFVYVLAWGMRGRKKRQTSCCSAGSDPIMCGFVGSLRFTLASVQRGNSFQWHHGDAVKNADWNVYNATLAWAWNLSLNKVKTSFNLMHLVTIPVTSGDRDHQDEPLYATHWPACWEVWVCKRRTQKQQTTNMKSFASSVGGSCCSYFTFCHKRFLPWQKETISTSQGLCDQSNININILLT